MKSVVEVDINIPQSRAADLFMDQQQSEMDGRDRQD
jgi:hypothetical protein